MIKLKIKLNHPKYVNSNGMFSLKAGSTTKAMKSVIRYISLTLKLVKKNPFPKFQSILDTNPLYTGSFKPNCVHSPLDKS